MCAGSELDGFAGGGGFVDRVQQAHYGHALFAGGEEGLVVADGFHEHVERALDFRHRGMKFAVVLLAFDLLIVFHVVGVAFIEVVLVDAAFVAEEAGGHLFVLLDVAGPRGVEFEGGAVAEFDHRAGEILDGVVFDQRRGDLAVGAAHHPGRFGIAHHPEGEVEPVHAEVDQRAAAGLLLVVEPRAGRAFGVEAGAGAAGHAAAAEPHAAGVIDFTETALFDQRLHRAGLRGEAVAEVDAELAVELFRGFEHLLGFGGVHRHRFFAEDVGARLETGDGQLLVLVVRDGDGEDVELLVSDHVDAFDIELVEIELLLRLFAAVRLAVRDRDDFDVGVGHIAAEVVVAHAEADYACLQFRHDDSDSFIAD